MKILLVAPEQHDVNSVPEIRNLSGLHRVQVLNGKVTAQELYNEARRSKCDVIHFATHASDHGIHLSDEEILEFDDVVSLVKLTGASLVFLNTCNAKRLSSYLVSRYVPYVIDSNIQMYNGDAWKFPLTYYEMVETHQEGAIETIDFVSSWARADNGDGSYAFHINTTEILSRPSSFDVKALDLKITKLALELEEFKKSVARSNAAIYIIVALSLTLALIHSLGVV
jgi:hypothetical protein